MNYFNTVVDVLLVVMAIVIVIDRHAMQVDHEREDRKFRKRVADTLSAYENLIEEYKQDCGPLTLAIDRAVRMGAELKSDLERAP